MSQTNLILCGFMGCGKTTLGREAAARLSYRFVDMDAYIEELTGKRIPEFFVQNGEEAFRQLETKVLASLCSEKKQVIATGGGALLRPRNGEIARAGGFVVFINSSFPLCYQRIQASDRPLVRGNSRDALEQIYRERLPIYQSVCHREIFNHGDLQDAVDSLLCSMRQIRPTGTA